MTRANVVIPNPRIPSILGTLNIAFGILLILSSLCLIAWTIMLARLEQSTRAARTPKLEERLTDLRARLQAEPNSGERARLQSQIDALEEEKADNEGAADLLGGQTMKDPIIAVPFWIDHGLGVILNLLMLASGVGLVALRPWGRKLALGVAGLKLAKLAVLTLVTVFVIVPFQITQTRTTWAKLEMRQSPGMTPARKLANDMALMTATYATVSAVGFGLVGMVYPALSLWLLNKPSTRAALHTVRGEKKLPNPAGQLYDLGQ